jgi:hypothetical protein
MKEARDCGAKRADRKRKHDPQQNDQVGISKRLIADYQEEHDTDDKDGGEQRSAALECEVVRPIAYHLGLVSWAAVVSYCGLHAINIATVSERLLRRDLATVMGVSRRRFCAVGVS